jgi:hypothetical protein
MLEFGLVSERLTRSLLGSCCLDEGHVDKVLLLMEKFSLLTLLVIQTTDRTTSAMFFVPAVTSGIQKITSLVRSSQTKMLMYIGVPRTWFLVFTESVLIVRASLILRFSILLSQSRYIPHIPYIMHYCPQMT